MKTKLTLLLLVLSANAFSTEVSILGCGDKIELMKRKHNFPGADANKVCEYLGGTRAYFREEAKWDCKEVDEYICEQEESLKMVACERKYDCI